MKFVDINSVRGLEIDQPVYTKDSQGDYGFGKLVKEEKTKAGIERTFEMALFQNEIDINSDGVVDQVLAKNITHVCIPK